MHKICRQLKFLYMATSKKNIALRPCYFMGVEGEMYQLCEKLWGHLFSPPWGEDSGIYGWSFNEMAPPTNTYLGWEQISDSH